MPSATGEVRTVSWFLRLMALLSVVQPYQDSRTWGAMQVAAVISEKKNSSGVETPFVFQTLEGVSERLVSGLR